MDSLQHVQSGVVSIDGGTAAACFGFYVCDLPEKGFRP